MAGLCGRQFKARFWLSGKDWNINTGAKGLKGPEKQRAGMVVRYHKLSSQNDSVFITATMSNTGLTEYTPTGIPTRGVEGPPAKETPVKKPPEVGHFAREKCYRLSRGFCLQFVSLRLSSSGPGRRGRVVIAAETLLRL